MTKPLVVGILFVAALARPSAGQAPQEFTKGVMHYTVDDTTHDLPLLPLAGSSTLTQLGKTSMLRLAFKGAPGSDNFAPNARMVLRNLTGPGTFDMTAVMNLVVEIHFAKAWSPNRQEDNCVLKVVRLQPSGVSGILNCTSQGPKFREIKFEAEP